MSIIFTFRFSFFPLYSLAEVNHAHSASLSLSLSLIIPDVANRRRRVRGGEGKGETDRFQGRGLASEEVRREIVRGGHRKGGWREARESLFSQKRAARAFGIVSIPSLVVRRINSFRRSWFARSLARKRISSPSLPLYLPPPYPPPFFFSLRSRCTCGHAGSN